MPAFDYIPDREVTLEVEKNFRSGMYTAKVNGVIIGDYAFKFTAKRAIYKYLKNNYSQKKIVWSNKVILSDK